MTVRHLRIDNRLIHGQVTVAWAGNLGANRLIVSNDEVAADDMQRMILPTSVLGIQETFDHCASDQAQGESIFVIAKLPADALALVQGGLAPEEINVGNQAPRPGTKFTMVTRSIAVTAEDAETYRAIAPEGFALQQRVMPHDKSDFLQVLSNEKL